MPPGPVVAHLNVFKNGPPHGFAGGEAFAGNRLRLEGGEEAFGAGVVIAIAFAALGTWTTSAIRSSRLTECPSKMGWLRGLGELHAGRNCLVSQGLLRGPGAWSRRLPHA